MNIAVLSFHSLGGSGVVAGEIARELARRGHHLHLIGAGVPGRLDPLPERVRLHRVPLEEPLPVGGQGFAVSLAARLAEIASTQRIDLVHAHYATPHAAAARLARDASAHRFAVVLTLHGSDVSRIPDTGHALVTRSLVESADAVTTPSRALADEAVERLQLRDGRIDVIPNFVDAHAFAPLQADGAREWARLRVPGERDWSATRVIAHASNFRAVKRVPDVVRAFAQVRERMRAVLLLAGDGPERRAAEHVARELRVEHDVAFLGPVADLASLYRASDVFLLPSVTESFGLVALEAMSCGVPVVASRAGGLPEVIVDGETGKLVPVGDVGALAHATLQLLQDEPLRALLGRGARERAVRLFQPPPIVDRWEALYARVLGKQFHLSAEHR